MKNKKIFLTIVIAILVLTACTKKGNEQEQKKDENVSVGNVTIDLNKYEKLEIGLTYEEVKKIIGGECNKTTETTYVCSGESAGTSATLTFENNKLKTKTQTGLE